MLYCKGATPPTPVAVIDPLALKHFDGVITKVTVGARIFGTEAMVVLKQPLSHL